MDRASGETLSLTPEQKERAIEILEKTIDGNVKHPTDILDSWDDPDSTINRDQKEEQFPRHRNFIDPMKIEGSLGMSDRLEKGRIKKILAHILKDNFEIRNSYPPVVQKRSDRFYVTKDGHHRCMVARAIGLERLYVEYSEVPQHLLE